MVSVSVSIPTHNRSEFVTEAIDSALDQTYADLEVVVFDDGSTDNTQQVLEQYEDVDRVRTFRSDCNLGQGAAKRRAASECEGEFIAFLDDDDLWRPTKINKQVVALESMSEEYCGIYCGLERVRSGDIVEQKQRDERGDLYPEILSGQIMPTSGTVVRRSHYEDVGGYDESFDRMPDWDLFIRLAREYKFDVVTESLLIRRDHPGNMVKDAEHGVIGRQLIWDKHEGAYQGWPDERAWFVKQLERKRGYMNIQQGNQWKAATSFWNVLRIDPSPRIFALFILSLLGERAFKAARSIT